MLPFSVCFSQHFIQEFWAHVKQRAQNRGGLQFRVRCDPGHLQSFETLSRVWQETEEREWACVLSAVTKTGARRERELCSVTRDCWNMPEPENTYLERLRLRGGNPGGRGGCEACDLRSGEVRESWFGSARELGMGNINKESSNQVKRKFQFHHREIRQQLGSIEDNKHPAVPVLIHERNVPGNKQETSNFDW